MILSSIIKSKEEREKLHLLFTDEKMKELAMIQAENRNVEVEEGPIISRFAAFGNKSLDCYYRFEGYLRKKTGVNFRFAAFIKMKPTQQSFPDAAKQLNQEIAAYNKHATYGYNGSIKFIVTFDFDERFDDILAKQNFHVIRYARSIDR